MPTVCPVGTASKLQILMAASTVTAVTLASSVPQQEEFPVATRTRDSASVNPMSEVH